MKLIEHDTDTFRAVHTQYLTSYKKGPVNTSENIKIEMVRTRKKLPNPATFEVVTSYSYPVEETILPIVKRMLMHYFR